MFIIRKKQTTSKLNNNLLINRQFVDGKQTKIQFVGLDDFEESDHIKQAREQQVETDSRPITVQ